MMTSHELVALSFLPQYLNLLGLSPNGTMEGQPMALVDAELHAIIDLNNDNLIASVKGATEVAGGHRAICIHKIPTIPKVPYVLQE